MIEVMSMSDVVDKTLKDNPDKVADGGNYGPGQDYDSSKGEVRTLISFERINSLLLYEVLTGILRWRVSPRRNIRAGSVAGTLHSKGYIIIQIEDRLYLAHRVAHLLMTGHWPLGNPEHENQIKSDNRWENIKDIATRSQNGANRGLQLNNTSGLKGVSWDKRKGKWKGYIKVDGKMVSLGSFDDPNLAGLTYDAAAKIVWGERFSFLNFLSEESDRVVISDRILRRLGL